jgi:post-segregation antitoxin (ccd killing protein)
VKITIYVPDDLAEKVKDKLGDSNISAICQAALRDELRREKALAKITEEGFQRVEVYDRDRGRDVAFQGRSIARSHDADQKAWLTAKGAIAVYDASDELLWDFANFDHLIDTLATMQTDFARDLILQIADALGEKYAEELDI